jgi:cation diffusion facilitator family transporter
MAIGFDGCSITPKSCMTADSAEGSMAGGAVANERRALRIALGLNALMFVVGLVAGVIAESVGLIADSLDMLADALAYGLSLFAIGRSVLFKARVARMSGVLLLILGIGVMLEVIRRAWQGSEPESLMIMATAVISLLVNATVIRLLARHRHGEVHLRAAWVFTRADVVANVAVILSALIVWVSGSRFPDLIVGCAIAAYVIREAIEILREARQSLRSAEAT